MQLFILILLILIYNVNSFLKSSIHNRVFKPIKFKKEVEKKKSNISSLHVTPGALYEPQIPIPQSIVSLGILIMFALVQYRITRSNNITNEKVFKLKKLEGLKIQQLSEPGEEIMNNIRIITQEIIELNDEALKLRTLIDIPGGPSFRLRVGNPNAVNAGSELKQQEEEKEDDEIDMRIDIIQNDINNNKNNNERISLLDNINSDNSDSSWNKKGETMSLGEIVRTSVGLTTVLILSYVLLLLQNETMVNTTYR